SKEQVADPWAIGDSGKPFNITIVVDSAAHEAFGGASVPHADFNVSSIAFSIDGTPATAVSFDSFDVLSFDDDLFAGLVDQIGVTFAAQFDGVTLPFGASVRL